MTDAKKAAKRAKFAKGLSEVRQKDAEDTLKRQMQDVLSREALQAAVRKRKSQGKR